MKYTLAQDGVQIQIKDVVILLIHFEVHVNILFIIKVIFFVLIKWSYRSFSQLCWLLSLKWLTYFEFNPLLNTHYVVSIIGSTPNHIPHGYRYLFNPIRHVYLLLNYLNLQGPNVYEEAKIQHLICCGDNLKSL